jgi:hypothetical protein
VVQGGAAGFKTAEDHVEEAVFTGERKQFHHTAIL